MLLLKNKFYIIIPEIVSQNFYNLQNYNDSPLDIILVWLIIMLTWAVGDRHVLLGRPYIVIGTEINLCRRYGEGETLVTRDIAVHALWRLVTAPLSVDWRRGVLAWVSWNQNIR